MRATFIETTGNGTLRPLRAWIVTDGMNRTCAFHVVPRRSEIPESVRGLPGTTGGGRSVTHREYHDLCAAATDFVNRPMSEAF